MRVREPFDAWSVREAAQALLLVAAALETGLLQLLERERTADEAARERGLDPRAVAICLGALEEVGVVERGRRRFRLTAFGRSRFVDPASPGYVAAELPLWRAELPGWLFLSDVLRSGRPLPEDDSPAFREALYRWLDAKRPERVAAVVERVVERAPAERPHVLDVGGGSGVYARAFAARGCRVTLLDRPETIRHVRGAFGLESVRGLTLVAGDFAAGLPPGPFDAVLVADVLHGLAPGEARALLRAVAGSATAGAVAAVVDVFRGRSRRAGFFAMTMLLHTAGGDAHAAGQVSAWLAEAGFEDARVEDLDAGRALLTARRAPGRSRAGG